MRNAGGFLKQIWKCWWVFTRILQSGDYLPTNYLLATSCDKVNYLCDSRSTQVGNVKRRAAESGVGVDEIGLFGLLESESGVGF